MNHQFTFAIAVHLAAALAAMALGAAMFLRSKGTFSHRVLGRAWVALMLVTVISTWWIRMNGSLSWIHGLSAITLFSLGGGVWFAVKGRISAHRHTMHGIFIGGLVAAGAFTLLPQRLLGQMLWSALGLI